MSVPRILLLAGVPPGEGSVGEIILRDICLYYPRGNICCFAVLPPYIAVPSPELNWLPVVYSRHYPRQGGIGRLGPHLRRLSCFPMQQYVKRVQMRSLVNQAVQLGREHRVEIVWAVLDRPAIIYMARKVATRLGAKLITTVWDPPEYISRLCLYFDWFSYHSLMREFGKVMRVAVRCGVMSEAMRDEYETRYGTESVILRHGIHPNVCHPPAMVPNEGKQFVIGFAGGIYAVREWKALLSALSRLGWQINGRDIVVRMMGSGADFRGSRGRMRIEYLGWRSVEETIEFMSQVDVTYLPYWFDESYGLAARLCFPTKLATYIASGRPVLFHGPENSSPAHFFRRFPVGLCCHSLEESKIIECLQKFATDKEFYTKAAAAGQSALEQELGLHVSLSRFAKLIGIGREDLLPI